MTVSGLLDTHCKIFVAGYEPMTPDFLLEVLWTRMVALRRESEKRESLRQEKAA